MDDSGGFFGGFGKGGAGAPMRDSQGNIVSSRAPNQFYDQGLSLKPSVSQDELKMSNKNALLAQIHEKK
jgi:hypothetical protein